MGVFVIPKRSFLLLLFLCFKLINSKKITSSDFNGTYKLNNCRRCKVLTDSFNYWLDKTSRGKYEGGDAAWEESKLKSYSRSEVRLVEIQEGLCSELKIHQDACYAINEESEQVLEKWWFKKDSVSLDLYTWLCIETLQHCCPTQHYGDACTPCPQDENNIVCGGHGQCDGDGTRKGNGTCICQKGYIGNLCEECAESFYKTSVGSCKVCHKACNGCSGEGADSCEACNSGWQLQSGMCVDIDECASIVCDNHQYCINTEGSYSCNECEPACKTCMGEGDSNCTSCEPPNVLWYSMCIENEFKENILSNTYKRIALYYGGFLLTLYISRTSRLGAAYVVLLTALLMYFLERDPFINTRDVLLHLLHTYLS